jgi:hypothetical protein
MKHLPMTSLARGLCAALLLALPARGQNESEAPTDFEDLSWPQVFETSNGMEVAIYQPQIHDWTDYRHITARSAVAVKPKDASDDYIIYGALTMEAETTVDKENRVVFFSNRTIKDISFPNAGVDEMAAESRRAVEGVLDPTRPLTVSLDRVIANAERYQHQQNVEGINLDPPPIFFSSEPAILVIFLGPAKFESIEGSSLFFATNTNWDVLLNPVAGTYYLLVDETWLSTTDVMNGPWAATTDLPAAFATLPDSEDWKDVRAALPPKPGPAPRVFVSDRPAELILTEGKPQIATIPGTKILYLTNSESDIFLVEGSYYLLTAGRWFRAEDPAGPWASAMDSIPEEFSRIPADHEKAHVLASVPGTPDAEEALITAQIPQTARVNREEATVEVKYEGEPEFVAIKDTTVAYAINTPNDVFRVDSGYYCCHKGVWFQAPAPVGPWVVCSDVPRAIYTIPASRPKHNVTYVYVYDSDPKTVTTGYTSGYNGSYVVGNLLVFGAGVWLASEIINNWDRHYHHCHWHYHPCHYSYGCGARYSWYYGGYYRGGYRYYGPYGGAGCGAIYNPWTGGYARGGAVYGPRGGAFAREAYNPWTDTYGARVGVRTPYGSWGRSVVTRGDEWVRAGHRSGARGTIKGFETSKGAGAIKVDRRLGKDTVVGKSKDGDMYVGRDGNVYRRDSNGDWAKLEKGGWNGIERPKPEPALRPTGARDGTRSALAGGRPSVQPSRPSVQPSRPSVQPSRPSVQPSRPSVQPSRPSVQPSRPSVQPSRSTPTQLQRDFSARQRGDARSSQSRSFSGRSQRGSDSGGRLRKQ